MQFVITRSNGTDYRNAKDAMIGTWNALAQMVDHVTFAPRRKLDVVSRPGLLPKQGSKVRYQMAPHSLLMM
jgi:hypothetical protein